MCIRQFVLSLACLAVCVLQYACTALPPDQNSTAARPAAAIPAQGDLASQYATLRASPGRVMQLQPAASQVRIHVFRGGRAISLGHNHVLSAPAFEGYFYLPDDAAAQARFDLVFRLDQLVFDVPQQRAALGPAFASPVSDAAIALTRAHMLGEENMQAERYPLVRIHSLRIVGEAPKFAALLAIELHGQTRELWVPLSVSGLPTQLQASGAFVLRQSDFGVHAYSVMGGLLAVQDEVLVEFSLVGN